MRIAIVYDHAAHDGSADVAGVLEAVRAVAAVLEAEGHTTTTLPVVEPLEALVARLGAPDLVFNLAEGLGGRADGEAEVAAALEGAEPPVTGASSHTLSLCRRKDRTNALLQARGVPVPAWRAVPPGGRPDWARFPAIVKPAGEDGSVGIDGASVVDDVVELNAALDRLTGDGLVQVFVGGRELNVGFVGREVLPVAEIAFTGRQRAVTYAAKWAADSLDDRRTPAVCPARLPTPLAGQAVTLARAAWAAVGGRGYGRVDLRTDAAGRAWVLEVNPNPDLAPDAGLARMAEAAGWGYAGLVRRILEEALS
jgi:D-alanine-D-alanine ligase